MDSGLKSRLSKHADDARLGGEVEREEGDQIQENRDVFIHWP